MHGVPERIVKHTAEDSLGLLVTYEWEYDCDLLLEDQDCFEAMEMSFGKEREAADYIYIYE